MAKTKSKSKRTGRKAALPYEDQRVAVRGQQQRTVKRSTIAQINGAVEEFTKDGEGLAARLIAHVNKARAVGLLIAGLNDGQFTFEFFQQNSGRGKDQLHFTYSTLKTFVSIANRLPQPVASMDEVRGVFQLDFQAAGLLTIPDSKEGGPSLTTWFVELTRESMKLKGLIAKKIEENPLDKWDPMLRADLKNQIQWLVDEVYAKL